MTLVRWDPFRDLVKLQETLQCAPGAWTPPVDIFEKGDHLVIRAEMPGINKEEIDIRVENGVLQMRGERKLDPEVTEKNAYRLERPYGDFVRSFTLPTDVDAGSVVATYRDGVLEIAIAKSESAKPKRIKVEAA